MELKEQIISLEIILNKNIELYLNLKKELEAEMAALKAHSFPDIEVSVKQKLKITHEIKTLEGSRLKALSLLSEKTGIPAKDMSLSKLAGLIGGEIALRLMELKTRLRNVVESVTEMNTFNQGVIERLMKINYDSAAYLKELIEPEKTYEKSGSTGLSLKAGQVVSRKM